MVNTESKCRLLRNETAAKSGQIVKSSSSTEKSSKRKRKRNDEINDNNEHTLANSSTTATSSFTLLKIDPVVVESVPVSYTSTTSHVHTIEIEDDQCNNEAVQSLSSPLLSLSGVLSLEVVDDDNNKYLGTSYLINNPSDSEGDNFDHNLHLQQQILINTLNLEENEQVVQPDDTYPDAVVLPSILTQTSNSWPIEKDKLQWITTRKKQYCLVMGNFSYIYMSKSEGENILNLRCQRRDTKCGAIVHLTLDTHSFTDTNDVNHNHPPDKFNMKQKILNQIIDHRLAAEPTAVLRVIERIYAEANLTDEEQSNKHLPRTAASAFYRKRSRRYPAHQKTQDFDIPHYYSINNRAENFVIYDGTKEKFDGRLLMYSTPK
ncbi:hypothetical protein I4U23_027532 [Adineta vaga]|nr:hypothetical protein I4U23_027532 [Adineta vaga]